MDGDEVVRVNSWTEMEDADGNTFYRFVINFHTDDKSHPRTNTDALGLSIYGSIGGTNAGTNICKRQQSSF